VSPLLEVFCLDTSFLVNGWQKQYSPDVFPVIWDELDKLMRQGRLSSCDEVYRDLEKQDDGLFAWAKVHRSIFCTPEKRTLESLKVILEAFPNYSAVGGKISRSDPWIIAHARTVGGIVVTDEISAPRQRKTLPPKMPDTCDALGIPWLKPIDFFRRAGFAPKLLPR
jgi:hypothetical protein